MWGWLLCLAAAAVFLEPADGAGAGAARLVCYVEGARASESYNECTHLVYAGDARGDKLDTLLKEYRKNNPRLKIVLRVAEIDKDLRKLLKSKHAQGLEIYDAHKSLNKTMVLEMVDTAKAAISSSGGGPLFLALPANPELLAKYYDLRSLVKKVDLMMVQTHALGFVKKMTYHPSRLSGMWDMMNTDSVVDLVVGLGVPASKVVISLPATARRFTLRNETLSTPGSPTVDDEPKEIDQAELCRLLQKGRWTLERDQDLSAPYAFKNTTWMSFEDSSSVDVKGKYARVRGLAGLALHKADRDVDTPCGPTLKTSLAKVLNQQSRAPRAAVLRSLEHEILSAPHYARALDALQVSPYRITQIVDSDGVIHAIREDTRTEFACSRQGYFVHPRSCARFYRCVKFDQLSPEYTVFEFDCPAGLAFDSRYEVCVWPGSLPDSQACPGSSEIAPVPHTRFVCPEHEGYYADPENCRWFFACLDHGKAPLTAYEFRCPFGLGFDAEKLKCDWPWLVPACGNIARYEAEAFGFSAATLTGAAGFQGQTADDINIAAHQNLVSGASLDNLVGIQGGFLTQNDALDGNFIASQEFANGAVGNGQSYQIGHNIGLTQGQPDDRLHYQVGTLEPATGNIGLVQPTQYNKEKKYTSGSIILGDYRLPTKANNIHGNGQNNVHATLIQNSGQYGDGQIGQQYIISQNAGQYTNGYNGYTGSFATQSGHTGNYESNDDNTGAYVHDPTGDYAEPYRHVDAPAEPYIHKDTGYKQTGDSYDVGKYSGSYDGSNYAGKYIDDNNGQYYEDNSGAYVESSSSSSGYKGDYSSSYNADNSGSYNADYSGSYSNDNSGQYEAGVYRADGHIGSGASKFEVGEKSTSSIDIKHGEYSSANTGHYLSDSKAYTGASHTLTAGAVNVGLVGKTTLVDVNYSDQFNYQGGYNAGSKTSHEVVHQTSYPGHVSYVSQPAVSISHVGTDSHNLDVMMDAFATTPTSSGVPTTATPYAVTTALPITTYKTTFVPEAPKSDIKQIFGYSQLPITYVQPTVVAVKEKYVTPKVEVTDYNQGVNYQYENKNYNSQQYESQTQSSAQKSESSGYEYKKPDVKFEDGISYTTAAPVVSVSTYKPQGFSHSQQTLHKVESVGFDYSTAIPVTEQPFKKLAAYTTGPSVIYSQSSEAGIPHSYSHQTIHKVEGSKEYTPSEETGYEYSKSDFAYEEPKTAVQYTTVQPAVVSTYQPQVFSHQTLHNVDASQIKTYSEVDSNLGYKYQKPVIRFEEAAKTVYEYSSPAPAVSTYQPQSFSHQTIHKVETQQYVPVSTTPAPNLEITYQQPAISVYQNPILKYTEKVTPVTYVEPAHKTQVYSHQTIHKVQDSKVYTPSIDVSSVDYQSNIAYQEPKSVIRYTTVQPYIAVQPAVSTYQPQVHSHQTLHKVEANKVKTYSHDSSETGYEYQKPSVKFEESPETVYQYSTASPAVVSTYKPQSFSHQTVHKIETQKYTPVSSTPKGELIHQQQPEVTVYENPIIKYNENVTPVTFVKPANVYTHTYQPIVEHKHEVTHITQPVKYETVAQQSYSNQNLQLNQEGYSYSQPEIQRDIELNAGKSYSEASAVSHQVYHQSNNQYDSEKDIVFVSSSPSTLAYEEHYAEYESPNKVAYKAQEYIPPKNDYQQSYTVSTVSTPIVQQHSSVIHKAQEETYYNPIENIQKYETKPFLPVQQITYHTSHTTQPRKESVHVSTFPGTTITTKYKQVAYEAPNVQVTYKTKEYLPPIVSTPAPSASSTFKPVSTTREYLPPALEVNYEYNRNEYLPPKIDNTYLPPITAKSVHKPTTPAPIYVKSTTEYNAPEYLPPLEETNFNVDYENFGYKEKFVDKKFKDDQYEEYTVSTPGPVQRQQNIVVESAKSNLLGFGTVGPNAGLVSPITYSTAAPAISTTTAPYKYSESTTQYKAPDYLPPAEDTVKIQRKQNIVVETAKSQQLGFGTVGTDTRFLSSTTYSTPQPAVSSSESYYLPPKTVTSTYTPIKQELVEVTPSVPVRRTKPKVAVVTKINDFNPLLVRKLGAVCSCQSPVLVLKGKRPNVNVQDFDDYENDYDNSGRGDISDTQWGHKSGKIVAPANIATAAPIVSSTFNPIIVPDDSYYQDYQEPTNYQAILTPKSNQIYSESFVSSTPAVISTTEKLVRINPRVKTVTVAPTYKTVLLNQEVTPTVAVKQSISADSVINSQAFDRYGPGGWRSRDETLQGSVDCQRAGLFRHPKQCNKFYACRWDCTKQRFTLHVFNCPVQLSFDPNLGACNWPSQGPACQGDTLLTNTL